MLYSLFSNLVDNYPIFNVFRYLTVRTGLAMFTSMAVVFFIGNPKLHPLVFSLFFFSLVSFITAGRIDESESARNEKKKRKERPNQFQ